MIAPTTVIQIRQLLNEGAMSQRAIAYRTGVSRGTVQAIASGGRVEQPDRHPADLYDALTPSGRPRRCPTCGGLVQMPCLLCHVRRMREDR